MVKLLENTFRAVNIGLVNEVAMMSRRLGLDAFEVIRAAATKPFGFMPFYPGPGLGGHCIPIDPLYLSWKLRTLKYQARFIELADTINSAMPDYVVERVTDALNDQQQGAPRLEASWSTASPTRRTSATCARAPRSRDRRPQGKRGAEVSYMDPLVPEFEEDGLELKSVDPSSSFAPYDAVVIVTDHTELDRPRLLREAQLIVDTRDAMRGVPGDRSKVYGL